MTKPVKNLIQNKEGLFKTQYEMCDVIYRKLHELMHSVFQKELLVDLETFKIRLYIHPDYKNVLEFAETSSRNGIGHVNFAKISTTELEDPVIFFILKQKDFSDKRPEIYSKWFNNIKNVMQNLLDEQKKYNQILNDINSIPMFSPTRKILTEKTS